MSRLRLRVASAVLAVAGVCVATGQTPERHRAASGQEAAGESATSRAWGEPPTEADLAAEDGSPQRVAMLPAEVRAALERIEDLTFNFDQPGFYAVLEHVRSGSEMPLDASAQALSDWSVALERPASLRGAFVQVEGVIGRSTSWTLRRDGDEADEPVTQLELHSPNQNVACTVILARPADDLPIGAQVRVSGYFVMVRQYYSASQRVQQALLIVARAPVEVAVMGSAARPRQRDPWPWLAATAAGLLLAWMVLRRAAPGAVAGDRVLRARGPAPESAAAEFQEWAADELPGDADGEGGRPAR